MGCQSCSIYQYFQGTNSSYPRACVSLVKILCHPFSYLQKESDINSGLHAFGVAKILQWPYATSLPTTAQGSTEERATCSNLQSLQGAEMFREDKTEPAVLHNYREPQTILWDTKCELASAAAALTLHPAMLPDAHDQPTQPAEFSATTPPFKIYLSLRTPGAWKLYLPPSSTSFPKGRKLHLDGSSKE